MKINNKISIISVALFLGVTVCLFAPFEMYVSNKDEMWFRLSAFWWIPILLSTVVITCICVIGSALKNSIKKVYNALLFSIALCAYVQGNFLNIDVGVMNGGGCNMG